MKDFKIFCESTGTSLLKTFLFANRCFDWILPSMCFCDQIGDRKFPGLAAVTLWPFLVLSAIENHVVVASGVIRERVRCFNWLFQAQVPADCDTLQVSFSFSRVQQIESKWANLSTSTLGREGRVWDKGWKDPHLYRTAARTSPLLPKVTDYIHTEIGTNNDPIGLEIMVANLAHFSIFVFEYNSSKRNGKC